MPAYTYKAKDSAGNTVTGSMEEASERAAAASLRDKGLLPMDIREMHAATRPAQAPEAGSAFARYLIYPIWTGVNLRALSIFFRQLATLLAAGMLLSEALRSVGSRSRGKLGRIIAEALENVERGGPLSATLARYPRVFSPLSLALVRVGETGGLLESMVGRIADYLEYELSIRRLITQAMFYPCMVLLAVILRSEVSDTCAQRTVGLFPR